MQSRGKVGLRAVTTTRVEAPRDRDPAPPTRWTPVRACWQFRILRRHRPPRQPGTDNKGAHFFEANCQSRGRHFHNFHMLSEFPPFLSQACLLIALNGAGQSGNRGDRRLGNAI